MSGLTAFFLGVFGGVVAELAALLSIRRLHPSDFPYWVTSWVYWCLSAVLILVGGGLAAIQLTGADVTPFLAVEVGAGAPLIIRRLGEAGEAKPETPKADERVN